MDKKQENSNPSLEGEATNLSSRGFLNPQLSPVLTLFREAVLRDSQLQEQLRNADSCKAVAEIANAYFRSSFRVEISPDLKRSTLRSLAEETFADVFRVTVEDLEQHILYQVNNKGEFLLGESELEMVAGSARLAASASCYGCSCGNTCAFARSDN